MIGKSSRPITEEDLTSELTLPIVNQAELEAGQKTLEDVVMDDSFQSKCLKIKVQEHREIHFRLQPPPPPVPQFYPPEPKKRIIGHKDQKWDDVKGSKHVKGKKDVSMDNSEDHSYGADVSVEIDKKRTRRGHANDGSSFPENSAPGELKDEKRRNRGDKRRKDNTTTASMAEDTEEHKKELKGDSKTSLSVA